MDLCCLLFKICLCDPNLTIKTNFVTDDSIRDVIHSLENDSIKLFKWFSDG